MDITLNKKISKDVFDAIRGTNKTLLLNSDDIQWVFKGGDITGESKDVDLSGGEITTLLRDKATIGNIPAIGYEMPDNGTLPGKATVRFMPSSGIRNYLGQDGLYIYHINFQTEELEQIASNVSMTKDNTIEMDISSSNGGYILITKGAARYDNSVPEGPDTWQSKTGIEGFVYRLYNVALTRDAEEAGLNDWTNRLETKTEDAAKVARGFFFSDEFQNKNYTNAQFVELLYKTMFGRSSDTAGRNYWLSCLDNGVSREYVFHGFAESQEFSELCDKFGVTRGSVGLSLYRDQNVNATGFIARLYTEMLGRDFDEDGLEYWCKAYITKERSIEDIASDGFLHSQELANQNLSNEEFVTRMYETFLDREPEEAGLNDWVGRLERGEVTRDTLVYGFTRSQEFANLKAAYDLP